MNKLVLLAIIVGLICAACTSDKNPDTNAQKDNLQTELSRIAEGSYSLKTPGMPDEKSVPLFLVFGTILKNWLTRLFGRAYQFICKK